MNTSDQIARVLSQTSIIALCERLGYKPRRLWRYWLDEQHEHAHIKLSSKEVADELRARMIANHREDIHGPLITSEPEEYDDWSNAPNFVDYSTGASLLVDELRKQGWRWSAEDCSAGVLFRFYRVTSELNEQYRATADSLPIAVTLAAMKCFGITD